ncbi:hypothetical protein FZEAL_7425 [Fusarium zealandicum]|uniref:Uncharacterized protein n=1 Tax=Fusarium zealandicum TaxID=1053134 RepID=A0A8H4XIN2_9HYPO|nr:hypothetical protein FZEAL_7425 [Fusarium zealandicum]
MPSLDLSAELSFYQRRLCHEFSLEKRRLRRFLHSPKFSLGLLSASKRKPPGDGLDEFFAGAAKERALLVLPAIVVTEPDQEKGTIVLM